MLSTLMPRRSLLLFLFLLFLHWAFAPLSRAADPVAVKIEQIGLAGFYPPNGGTAWVQASVTNTTDHALSFTLVVAEVSLDSAASPMGQSFYLPLSLNASEQRSANVPLNIVAGEHHVVYAEARDENGLPIGRTARRVGPRVEGRIIGLICATPELCRTIQQSILLSGSPEEQTHKSQTLRMAQLTYPLSEGWVYTPANQVILAAPVSRLSTEQRNALELYIHQGGRLVLIEDQTADGLSSYPGATIYGGKASLPSPADANSSKNHDWLEPYRIRGPFGKSVPIGSGALVRLPSVSSKEFGDYFRPVGFSDNTPQDIRKQFQITSSIHVLESENSDEENWLMRRIGTTFRFPSFLEILIWMIAYLLLVGLVNFIILRRIRRPELAWITIPGLALLISVMLYVSSARNRPRNFGLDNMVVYHMDSLSPLAIAEARVRISAPLRSPVTPQLPKEWVYLQRNRFQVDGVDLPSFLNNTFVGSVQLTDKWQTTLNLRKWSFTDLNFFGAHNFAGTIYRDSTGHLHNDTGISYQQAIVADHENVFILGDFPAGAVVDLGHVERRSYSSETGRVVYKNPAYPGPPFPVRAMPDDEDSHDATPDGIKRAEAEWAALAHQPFSLLELIRSWSHKGDNVFYQTKAVFFGLSDQATIPAQLAGRSPDRKAASLTIVTFQEWP